MLNSAWFYTLYGHTYLTLLIYTAGDFVHFTSVSDIVFGEFCTLGITILYNVYQLP